MLPILTTQEMREADAHALQGLAPDALLKRAGVAVALEAKRLLGACYGKRVCVLAGPGMNGDDGRLAGKWLESRGGRVTIVDALHAPRELDGFDLVIDAAFGIGCTRPYIAPIVPPSTRVLAVDVPSGIESDTGEILGKPMQATVTLALGAVKWGHLSGPSVPFVGTLRFAGLGIVDSFRDGLLDDDDLNELVQSRIDDHKWSHALEVLAGSTPMPGAAELVVRGALAGGASMIRLSSHGDVASSVSLPPEIVHSSDGHVDKRVNAVVAGPGLGKDAPTWLRDRLSDLPMPVVLDADALDRSLIDELSPRNDTWLLTPHEGEFQRLTGSSVSDDRVAAVRTLAMATGCVVLLKGPRTIIARSDGSCRVVNAGTATLATAGSGDVLSGLIGATIARGHSPFEAAALAAHLHGRAGSLLPRYSTASDIIAKVHEIIVALD